MTDTLAAPVSAQMVPGDFAEKAMASLMSMHTELMDEKERRVELYRKLMEREQTVAELRMYIRVLEEKMEPVSRPVPVAAPPPPPSVQKNVQTPRIPVGSILQAAKLIRQPKPIYPQPAKQVRIQGIVKLHALISKEGTIEGLKVVSGHPLLVPSALEAVKQWAYQPTLLVTSRAGRAASDTQGWG